MKPADLIPKPADLIPGEIVVSHASYFKANGPCAKVLFATDQKVLVKFDCGNEICFTREKHHWYKYEIPMPTHEEIMNCRWELVNKTEVKVIKARVITVKSSYVPPFSNPDAFSEVEHAYEYAILGSNDEIKWVRKEEFRGCLKKIV